MRKDYSNSLDNVSSRSRNKSGGLHVISKDDIMTMFDKKESEEKSRGWFRLFR